MIKRATNISVMALNINEETEEIIETIISKGYGYKINTMAWENNFLDSKQGKLSEREREVLSNIVLGNNYKQIASSLFISVNTVCFHVKNIYRKFNIHSQSEAVVLAMRNNLV